MMDLTKILKTNSFLLLLRKALTSPRAAGEVSAFKDKEATMGIEPMLKVLQTSALPLGYVALILRS